MGQGDSTVDEILAYAEEKGEAPFIIMCDEIEDSHNLGAIIRTAEACDGLCGLDKPHAERLFLG